MKTKQQLISEFKKAYPTLKKGDDMNGYVELTDEEYESTIELWADNTYADLLAEEEKANAKSVLLAKLGITAEEAQLLLS